MPDELARQSPVLLFKMLDTLSEDSTEEYTGDNEYLKMFYGK